MSGSKDIQSLLERIRQLCDEGVPNQDGTWVDAEAIERILDEA